MSVRKFKVGMAAVLILGIVALFFVVPALSQGPALPPGEYELEEGQYVFNVSALTPASATDTPMPPTDTPIPPTGHDIEVYHALWNGPAEPFAGAPACQSMTEENCHWDHTHNADPSRFDSVFGPVGALYDGGEISYPWETPNENALKHEGYMWDVGATDDPKLAAVGVPSPCARYGSSPNDLCITRWRVQLHEKGGQPAFVTRFHSYWMEVEICAPDMSLCGTLQTGGWADFGPLFIESISESRHVPLPDDPPMTFPWPQVEGGYKVHLSDDDGIYYGCPSARGECTYQWHMAENNLVSFSFYAKDDWQGVNEIDPFIEAPICPNGDCELNHSNVWVYYIVVKIQSIAQFAENGLINFSGFTDRNGNIVPDCSLGVDCIPLEIVDVPRLPPPDGDRANVYFSTEGAGFSIQFFDLDFDYDLAPPGEAWIKYPE